MRIARDMPCPQAPTLSLGHTGPLQTGTLWREPAAEKGLSAWFGSLVPAGNTARIERGQEIVGQDDPALFCFQVQEGVVRCVHRLEDGRRQVSEFLLPGDVFGLDAGATHAFAAEAVTEATIRKVRFSAVEAEAEADPRFAQALRQHMAAQAKAIRGRLVLLGRLTAAERVAAFLLEMNDRLGQGPLGQVDLPMCRSDMADYLGLTIETVSRCLAEMKRSGAIAVKGARILIRNRRALAPEAMLH
ncbi:helix-turn-helix domain-containing protein [Acidisoma sp. C75]